MIFTDPSWLWLGAPLTTLILLGVWSHGRRRRKLAGFLGGTRALTRLSRHDLSGLRLGRSLLLGLSGLCLAVAAAEPRWIEPDAPEPPPIDQLVLALDVSASMQATDVDPTRLARAVALAREVLSAAGSQKVGLLVYAGISYPLAPPTLDHRAVNFLLGGVVPTMASAYDPGTLASVAVRDAAALLESTNDSTTRVGRRRIVLISDGDDGEPERVLLASVDSVHSAGFEVHVIGVGTERGAGMSLPGGTYQLGGPVTTASGARASSRLDEEGLRSLAEHGGGRYAHADAGIELAMLVADATAPPPPVVIDDTRPVWARYDLPFVLGMAALVLTLLESLLDASLPRLTALRQRRVT